MKLAVFWEPPSVIGEIISEEKERCRALFPTAIYLDHPLHSTFFLLHPGAHPQHSGALEADLRAALAEMLAASTEPIVTRPEGWFVFENDLATGGDTVTIAFEGTPALHDLQQRVAVTCLPFRGDDDTPESDRSPAIEWSGPFAESHRRYGFPFVGPHWKPHTTVASLPRGAPIISQIVARPIPQDTLIVNRLSLWRIDGGEHTRIADLPIGPGPGSEGRSSTEGGGATTPPGETR